MASWGYCTCDTEHCLKLKRDTFYLIALLSFIVGQPSIVQVCPSLFLVVTCIRAYMVNQINLKEALQGGVTPV